MIVKKQKLMIKWLKWANNLLAEVRPPRIELK